MYGTDNTKIDFIRMYLGVIIISFIMIAEMYFHKDYYLTIVLAGIPLIMLTRRFTK